MQLSLQSFFKYLCFCGQDLSSLQATITTQTAAFTMNGSDLYEEMVSRFHILSTGNQPKYGFLVNIIISCSSFRHVEGKVS